MNYLNWCMDGGQTTIRQFQKLSADERMDIIDYLEEFSLYEEVSANQKDYILVHADWSLLLRKSLWRTMLCLK